MTWRAATILLALTSVGLMWRDCRRPATKAAPAVECERDERVGTRDGERARRASEPSDHGERGKAGANAGDGERGGLSMHGFRVPSWALGLLPQPGENLLAYRDRIVPLAQAAIAPHRSRVARGRDDFARAVDLDVRQRAELDSAVAEAATQIQDRVLGAALGGDFAPATFKPMTGVALAREVLDIVEHANKRFVGTLREDQRAAMARHPFDLADYLVFSTRWEDALGYGDR
jgi:hypothetical protein